MERSIIDRKKLTPLFPTQFHPSVFWEKLGRAIATFGFLEETLAKAIFAFTATRKYDSNEIEAAYKKWLPQLELALTGELRRLADSYGTAARNNPETTAQNIDELVADIKKASSIRNVLCHGSWQRPNINGASIPLFIRKVKQGSETSIEVFQTPIDVAYLEQLQMHVTELACDVIDTVTLAGWRFPGGTGPGKPVI